MNDSSETTQTTEPKFLRELRIQKGKILSKSRHYPNDHILESIAESLLQEWGETKPNHSRAATGVR